MKKIILILLSLSFFTSCSYALISDFGFDPLDQTCGAKPLGMGGAFVGASKDINCLFYNPAGLANSKGITVSLKDEKNFSMGVGYETGIGNIGVGAVYKSYKNFDLSNNTEVSYDNSTVLAGYGIGSDRLSFGFSVKTSLSQRLSITGVPDRAAAAGSDYDIGVLWKPLDFASIGVVSHNASGTSYKMGSSDEAFPKSTRTGLILDVLGNNAIFNNEVFGVRVAYDIENGNAGDNEKHNGYYGLEGSYNGWFFVRLGGSSIFKADNNVICPSSGLGFKFGDTSLDIASIKDPVTEGQISYLSVSYTAPEFVLFKAPEEEKPEEVKPEENKPQIIRELLKVDSPEDDYITYDENIIVSGETRPGASVLINGVHAYIEADGGFRAVQPLISGKNLIEIIAGLDGETKKIEKKVLKKAKVIIEEEKEINKKIVQEVLSKEADIAKKQDELNREKEKGIDVSEKEKLLLDEKAKHDEEKTKLLGEKKKLEERKEKVESLVTLGVIELSPEKKFEIEAPITRGEMISWLVKASGLQIPKVEGPVFSDVPQNHQYAPYIKAASDAGFIQGANGKFRPDDPVKEEEGQEFFRAFGIVK